MKKILVLGGGVNQLQLILAAKSEGYYIVLCDKNDNCVARDTVDIFYCIDIIDEEAVYKVAEKELVAGVVSNSEVVMSVVAKVAMRLGLVGNPVSSINTLMSKYLFRQFQQEIGVFSPKQVIIGEADNFQEEVCKFKYPIVFKPSLCSGSRGTKRYDKFEHDSMKETLRECIRFSRESLCVVEEYVQMPSLLVLEGDLFVSGGKIWYEGLYFTKRSKELPMVPMTYMYPYVDTSIHLQKIKETFDAIFGKLNINHGQFNVEGYFDNSDNFFVIEINCRQGGHGLPGFLKGATGVDMNKLLVTTAVGDDYYYKSVTNNVAEIKYLTRHSVFSNIDGFFEGVYIHNEIKGFVQNIELVKDVGEVVEKRKNGSSVVGFVNMLFETYEQQHYYSENIEKYIQVIIKET